MNPGKKILWICIGLLVFGFLVALPLTNVWDVVADYVKDEESEITRVYDPSTFTITKDGGKTNTTTIYSRIRYIYEDETWKKREEARSFKDSEIKCNVYSDGINLAECLDYNETSRTILLSSETSRTVPLKKYNLEFNEISKETERVYDTGFETELDFNAEEDKVLILKANPNEIIEFGEHSTEIILNETNTGLTDDSWVADNAPDQARGTRVDLQISSTAGLILRAYLKFNITAIPGGQQIDNATLWLKVTGDGANAESLSVHHVNDTYWVEGIEANNMYYPNLTWASQPCGNTSIAPHVDNSSHCNLTAESATTLAGGINVWEKWTVINSVTTGYAAGDKNVSFLLKHTAEDDSGGWNYFHSKEAVATANTPWLNITYSVSPTLPPVVTNKFPKNSTQVYETSYVNFTYNTTDPDGVVGNCSLWIKHSYAGDWEENETDVSITHTINQTFNISLDYENIYWKVGCYDDDSLQANSSEFNYTRLKSTPRVTLRFPKNTTQDYTPFVNFTYNVSTPVGTISSCDLWLNATNLNATDATITQTVNQTFNITTLDYGNVKWKVECISSYNHRSNSTTFNYSRLAVYPSVTLVSPKNNTEFTARHINLTYNTTIAYGTVDACYLWLDDGLNMTNKSITHGINQSFNITINMSHVWEWKVECNSSNNLNTNSSIQRFIYNTAPTTPTTLSPQNNTLTIINSQILICNGSTDSESDTINYEFWGADNKSGLTSGLLQNSTSTIYNWTGLSPAVYYWRCRTNDNRANSDYTPMRVLTFMSLIANCTGENSTAAIAYNFSFAEETNLTRLYNISFESTFTFWGTNKSSNKTVNTDITAKNEVLFCISPKNVSFYTNAMIEYKSGGYDIRNYYLRNATMDNVTDEIMLYSLPIALANGISITVTDEIDDPLGGVYIKIQRYYTGEDLYRTIAMGRTDDIGEDYVYLRKYDAWYKFIMEREGVVLYTSEPIKIDADSLTLKIAETTLSALLDKFDNINYNLSYMNRTRIFTVIWVDTAANMKYGCLSVVDRDPAGDTWVCHDCLHTTSGILTCNVSTYATGNHTLIATFYVDLNPLKTIATRIVSSWSGRLYDLIGLDGVVVTLFITGTAAFAALWWSPAGVIILGLIGFVSSIWLQAINVTYGAALAIIIAAIIIIIQQSKGRS